MYVSIRPYNEFITPVIFISPIIGIFNEFVFGGWVYLGLIVFRDVTSMLRRDWLKLSWRRDKAICSPPLTSVKWHSHPRPDTVTVQPIRLFTNSMTFIPILTLIDSRVVSMEHLQRVWHANKESSLPFWTPCSVPFLSCLCSNCRDQLCRTCRVFSWLFTLNNPRHFLDFCLEYYCTIFVWNTIVLLYFSVSFIFSPSDLRSIVELG